MRKTRLGTGLYAVGSAERSAFISGIKVKQVKIAAYVFSGLFAALGGIFLSLQTLSGDASVGLSYTMNSVAAAVIGGTTLAGGIGGPVRFPDRDLPAARRCAALFSSRVSPPWRSPCSRGSS